MTRIEENEKVIQVMADQVKDKPNGTFEEMVCFQLGVIATMLADISKSLAIISDSRGDQNDERRN